MYQKYLRTIFFIILFSIASVCIISIPYLETKTLDQGSLTNGSNLSKFKPFQEETIEFPWRSYNQEIFINISLNRGKISIQLIGKEEFSYFLEGNPYVPYWEVINTTGLTTNIPISPPIQGYNYILFYAEEDILVEENIIFYWQLKIKYLRYASSYWLFFLGIAIILISYYSYFRYQCRRKD